MLIPFPIRIPVLQAFLFTCLLVLVQLLEGTDPRYSGLVFCFFMLSVFAFNTAGGFSRPSGSYIFSFALLVVVVGTIFKAALGEPAQTHLRDPLTMMGAYVVSMLGMWIAALISRRVATSVEGVAGLMNVRQFNYYESALGCLVLNYLLVGAAWFDIGGQIVHSLYVVNPFGLLAMLLSTIAAIRDSNGRRSTSALSLFALGSSFYIGAMAFSKQGMFTQPLCWLLGVAWARYRLRLIHFIFIGVFIFLAQYIMVPMATVTREDVITGTLAERQALVEYDVTHVSELRQRYLVGQAAPDPGSDVITTFYYDRPQGVMDRLSMMPNDSLLMQFTGQGHYFGYLAVRYYFENWMPHLLFPHKLDGIRVGGNAYMHEMDALASEDNTTGISFSPTAEAYHIDGWRGVLLLAPAVWIFVFCACDAVCGDTRLQPLGLIYILTFAHVAPEGGIGSAIDMVRLLNLGVVLGLSLAGYIAPVLGILLRGRVNRVARRTRHLPEAMPPAGAVALDPA